MTTFAPLHATGSRSELVVLAGRGDRTALRIELLGGFRVSVGVRTVEDADWYLRKSKALIKLLALSAHHRLHRGWIMDLLWPELDERSAGNNLHKVLYVARRALEPSLQPKQSSRFLDMHDGLIILNTEAVWIDIEAFRAAAARARETADLSLYREAIDLYQGELLPEDRYEEWTLQPREELRRSHVTLLLELANLHAGLGQRDEAARILNQVIGIDRVNEQAHFALMQLLVDSGQRQEALRQYAMLRESLASELGAQPDETTQRWYTDILSGRRMLAESPPALPASTKMPDMLDGFVGRQDALQRMRTHVDSLVRGRGNMVLVHGHAGSGKSHLVRIVRDEAAERGAISLWGASYPGEQYSPYGPLAIALEDFALHVSTERLRALADEHVPTLASLAPAFSRVLRASQQTERRSGRPTEEEVTTALVSFFRALCDQVPVVITLEDLHHADPGTMRFLAECSSLVPQLRILFLCTFGYDEDLSPPHLDWLTREIAASHRLDCLGLEPLTGAETTELAVQLLGGPISAEVRDIIENLAQGSPYYVEETVWALRGRQRLEQVDGTWQLRRNIRVTWTRDDLRRLVDASGDFRFSKRLRAVQSRTERFP